jgi:nitroreductase
MLAARALGLGTVLTTTHRIRRAQTHALLGIPTTYESAALIPLGWPDRAYGPNRRAPVETVVCYDHWSE